MTDPIEPAAALAHCQRERWPGDDIESSAQRLSDLLEQMRVLSTYGCSNFYCAIAGPAKGMHTYSGCHCIQEIGELGLEIAVESERLWPYTRGRCFPLPKARHG